VSLVSSLGAGELQLGGGAVLQLTISGQVALLADTQVGIQLIFTMFFELYFANFLRCFVGIVPQNQNLHNFSGNQHRKSIRIVLKLQLTHIQFGNKKTSRNAKLANFC
jgi:hypothetical protein